MKTDANAQQGSKFTFYIGIVLEDREKESTKLKVTLRENLPFISGDIKSKDETVECSSGSSNQSGKVKLTNTIEADYFNLTSNRRYPPDIKRNEQVLVFNYADSDKYYWIGLGREDFLRRTERLTWSVSNTPEAVEKIDDDNSYFFEMDTINKHVRIMTSKSDEEKFKYCFKIDTENNKVVLCDDDNNEIVLDSNIPRIYMKNKNGSIVDINEDTITLSAPKDIIVKAGRQFVLETPTTTIKTKSMVVESSNTLFKAGNTFKVTAPCIGLDGHVLANSIISGPIMAKGYGTCAGVVSSGGGGASGLSSPFSSISRANTRASAIPQYTSNETNVIVGKGTTPSNVPLMADYEQYRHASAWEQVRPAIHALADACDLIDQECCMAGVEKFTSVARQLADLSIMYFNRGE